MAGRVGRVSSVCSQPSSQCEGTNWRFVFGLCVVSEKDSRDRKQMSKPQHNEAVSDFVYFNCLSRWFFFFLWTGSREEAVISLHWVQILMVSRIFLSFGNFYFFLIAPTARFQSTATNWSILVIGRLLNPFVPLVREEKRKLGSGESGSGSAALSRHHLGDVHATSRKLPPLCRANNSNKARPTLASLPFCHPPLLESSCSTEPVRRKNKRQARVEMWRLRSGRCRVGSDGTPFPTRRFGSAPVSEMVAAAPCSTLKLTRTDQQQDFLKTPMGTAELFMAVMSGPNDAPLCCRR